MAYAHLFSQTHFIPCWKTELRLVLQMIRSAHCTTTMLAKNAVWHVNSTIFLCSYVWENETLVWYNNITYEDFIKIRVLKLLVDAC